MLVCKISQLQFVACSKGHLLITTKISQLQFVACSKGHLLITTSPHFANPQGYIFHLELVHKRLPVYKDHILLVPMVVYIISLYIWYMHKQHLYTNHLCSISQILTFAR